MPRSRNSSVNSDEDKDDVIMIENGDRDHKRSRKDKKPDIEEGDTELAEKEMDTEYFMSIENMKWNEDEIEELKAMPLSERLYFPDAAGFSKEVESLELNHTVVMGPATMDDLANPDIFDMLQTSMDFKLHFSKQNKAAEFGGYIKMVFSSEDEASQCAKNLAHFRDNFSVLHLKPEGGKEIDSNAIIEAAEANDSKKRWVRVGVLTGIPRCVTLDDVSELFPEAQHVWFPYSKLHKSRKWHAYIEFKSKDELEKVHHQVYMIGDFKFKLMRLHDIPSANELGKRVEEAKKNVPTSGQMSTKSRIEMIKLLQYTRHYMTSEDVGVSKEEHSIMKAFNNMLRNKLNSDNRRRKERRDDSKSRDRDRSRERSRATKRRTRSPSPRNDEKRTRKNSDGERECYMCGKTGHIIRDCPRNSSGSACFKCGQNGHIAKDCMATNLEGGRKCYGCGGVGHMKKDCPGPMMGGSMGGNDMMNSGPMNSGPMNMPPMGNMNSGMDPLSTAAAVLMSLVGQQNAMNNGGMGPGNMGSSMGGGTMGGGTMGGGTMGGGTMGSSSYDTGSSYGNGGYSGTGGSSSGGKSCYTCSSFDHIARDCPNKTATGSGTTCYFCGNAGHYARDCPDKEKGSVSKDDKDCFLCGSLSHVKKDCPQNPKSASNLRNTTCYSCGSTGHMKNECPTSTGTNCYNCGETGHMARDCKSRSSRSDRDHDDRKRDRSEERSSYSSASRRDQCFHCGSSGHFARDCPVKEVGGLQRCFRCGVEGHMSKECRV